MPLREEQFPLPITHNHHQHLTTHFPHCLYSCANNTKTIVSLPVHRYHSKFTPNQRYELQRAQFLRSNLASPTKPPDIILPPYRITPTYTQLYKNIPERIRFHPSLHGGDVITLHVEYQDGSLTTHTPSNPLFRLALDPSPGFYKKDIITNAHHHAALMGFPKAHTYITITFLKETIEDLSEIFNIVIEGNIRQKNTHHKIPVRVGTLPPRCTTPTTAIQAATPRRRKRKAASSNCPIPPKVPHKKRTTTPTPTTTPLHLLKSDLWFVQNPTEESPLAPSPHDPSQDDQPKFTDAPVPDAALPQPSYELPTIQAQQPDSPLHSLLQELFDEEQTPYQDDIPDFLNTPEMPIEEDPETLHATEPPRPQQMDLLDIPEMTFDDLLFDPISPREPILANISLDQLSPTPETTTPTHSPPDWADITQIIDMDSAIRLHATLLAIPIPPPDNTVTNAVTITKIPRTIPTVSTPHTTWYRPSHSAKRIIPTATITALEQQPTVAAPALNCEQTTPEEEPIATPEEESIATPEEESIEYLQAHPDLFNNLMKRPVIAYDIHMPMPLLLPAVREQQNVVPNKLEYTTQQINTILDTMRMINKWQQREADLLFQTMDPRVFMYFLRIRMKTLTNSVHLQEKILAARQVQPTITSIFRTDTLVQQCQWQTELLRTVISHQSPENRPLLKNLLNGSMSAIHQIQKEGQHWHGRNILPLPAITTLTQQEMNNQRTTLANQLFVQTVSTALNALNTTLSMEDHNPISARQMNAKPTSNATHQNQKPH